jgi:uncharacterized protein (UPF0335 family)
MVAFKNRVMDLENYRGPSNAITDHEQRTWLSRSLLLHAEMRRAFGNLESNKVLLASALPTAPGAGPPNKLPFHELHAYMLDQAHKIDASVKQTAAKESRRVHEAESSRLLQQEVDDIKAEASGAGEDVDAARAFLALNLRNGQP